MQDGNYVNSLKDGKWIYYRSDGSIQKVVNYQNGEKEGEAMSWYLNGNKEIMENYSLGLMPELNDVETAFSLFDVFVRLLF